MIAWGSWANTQKIAEKNWRFELFYRDKVYEQIIPKMKPGAVAITLDPACALAK